MTTSSLSALPSALASLLTQYGANPNAANSASGSAAASSAATLPGSALGSDPAYTLSLGQQDSGSALIGYSNLGKLGSQFESSIADVESAAKGAPTTAGSVAVVVSQLAQAQTLQSGPFGDPDSVSLGTGTLTLTGGTVDATTGAFTATGGTASIAITNGSLNDIANSINTANVGLTASVIEEGGGYGLQLTGQTGAANAFKISGLSELNYDPGQPQSSALTTTAAAEDAQFTADGVGYGYGSNTDVPVAFGVTTNFTQTGATSVAKSTLPGTVQSLVDSFNTLQSSIASLTDTKGNLVKDANLAAGLFKNLGDAATGSVDGAGSLSALSDIGVTVQSDGTLSIDQATLAKAIATHPNDVQSLISQVSKAMDNAVSPYVGSDGAISSQVSMLTHLSMRGSSLIDYLNGTAGQSSSGNSLLDYLNGSSGSSSGTSGNTLLDYLNASSSSASSSSFSSTTATDSQTALNNLLQTGQASA